MRCWNLCKAHTRRAHGWPTGIARLWKRNSPRKEGRDEHRLFASGSDPRKHHGQARMRGMLEDRRFVGTPAPVHGVWARGLLRLLEKQARDETLSPDPAPADPVDRARRKLGLVLRGPGSG